MQQGKPSGKLRNLKIQLVPRLDNSWPCVIWQFLRTLSFADRFLVGSSESPPAAKRKAAQVSERISFRVSNESENKNKLTIQRSQVLFHARAAFQQVEYGQPSTSTAHTSSSPVGQPRPPSQVGALLRQYCPQQLKDIYLRLVQLPRHRLCGHAHSCVYSLLRVSGIAMHWLQVQWPNTGSLHWGRVAVFWVPFSRVPWVFPELKATARTRNCFICDLFPFKSTKPTQTEVIHFATCAAPLLYCCFLSHCREVLVPLRLASAFTLLSGWSVPCQICSKNRQH